MKKFLFIVLFIASPYFLMAQCNQFFNFEGIKGFEQESFNAKDKPQGRNVFEILDYKQIPSGFDARFKTTFYGKKDKPEHEGEYSLKCENGVVYFDLRNAFPSGSLEAYKDMEMTFSGTNLEVPASLAVGDKLKDALIKVDINNPSIGMVVKVEMEVLNRKVVGQENVTTPAGSFNTFVIESEMNMVSIVMGMKVPMKFKSKEWFAEKVGAVRSESFDKNGKLTGYTILTKIIK
jgi:hypothetical protein